ncbi:MAG: NAD(P)/FAD-dependent oxidoreductase [Candidatus Eremiobacteraeota bacterium]|nr:NAD(P)/FAD-dependent oxidoreductase [Candidatus Eremiobacteraeota bacterium]MBV9736866.1 NAD(P)/FAD-dependent oxidoreductase [Candidatus Eremiobacteraeota bacterium]
MRNVIVVGGGPAGSTCAARLAKRGLDVTLLERTAFPRTKVCGEYLNAAAQDDLNELGVGAQIAAECNRIEGIRLHVDDIRLELPFAVPAWALARSRLDDILLRHATRAGARTITARVERIERTGQGVRIGFTDASGVERTLEADIVVGADGLGSIVARKCGLSRSRKRGRFAVGGHYSGFGALGGFIEMYVTTKAYFAINPLSGELANVMIVVDESDLHRWTGAVDEHMKQTALKLASGKRGIDSVRRIGKRVAIGPLSHEARAAAGAGVYLVGDAAGFVDPFTGQGVFLALRSAKLAADAIEAELAEKESAKAVRARYAQDHANVFGARARVAALVSFLIRTPWLTKRAARNLERSTELRSSIMAAIAGQQTAAEPLNSAMLLRLVA